MTQRKENTELLNKLQIAETENFLSKIYDTRFEKIYKKIREFVYPQLRQNPYFGPSIKKLKGDLEGIYRYRVGSNRLFYIIDKEKILVIILDLKERKDAY
jgi:mRNA interferase RelE/StbE